MKKDSNKLTKTKTFFTLSIKDKKQIIKESVKEANKMQRDLVNKYRDITMKEKK